MCTADIRSCYCSNHPCRLVFTAPSIDCGCQIRPETRGESLAKRARPCQRLLYCSACMPPPHSLTPLALRPWKVPCKSFSLGCIVDISLVDRRARLLAGPLERRGLSGPPPLRVHRRCVPSAPLRSRPRAGAAYPDLTRGCKPSWWACPRVAAVWRGGMPS